MARMYVQSITLKRRVESADAQRSELLFNTHDTARSLVLPDGFQVSEIDVYSLYTDKDGQEHRHWDE